MFSVAFVIIVLAVTGFGQLTSDVDRLMTELFDKAGYIKVIRPVVNISTITQVNISFTVFSVRSVDVASGKITIHGKFTISWKDEFLSWNKTDHNGIDSFSLPPNFVWTPGIAVSRGSINDVSLIEKSDYVPMWAYSTGLVYMFPTGEIVSTCYVDTSLYPFDSHECKFILISARYSLKEVRLISNQLEIDLKHFEENTEWIVENLPQETSHDTSGDCMDMSYVTKRLKVTRRPAFVIIHTFVPEMLITLLNLATCYVPFDSGERLSFAITIFMSFVFLSGTIVYELPRNSITISFVSYTILSLNILNVLLVIWSIVVVRVSRWSTEEYKMPEVIVRMLVKDSGKSMELTEENGTEESSNVDYDDESNSGKSMALREVKGTGESGDVDYDAESNQMEQTKTFNEMKIKNVSWYQFALLLDKIQFIVLVTIITVIYIIEMTVLTLNHVF